MYGATQEKALQVCETCFYRKAKIPSSTRVLLTEDPLCCGSWGPVVKGIRMGQSKAGGGGARHCCWPEEQEGASSYSCYGIGEATWAREPCAVAA